MNRNAIIHAILDERARQYAKWSEPHDWGVGDCSSPGVDPAVKVMVLTEELGEVARAVLDGNGIDLRNELVQLCAVAVAWLELLGVAE